MAEDVEFESLHSTSVPSDDRSFLYGDGLFETLLCVNGKIPWLRLHKERLLAGARVLRFPIDVDGLFHELEQEASNLVEPHSLRLSISRGSGPRGYAGPEEICLRERLRTSPLNEDPMTPRSPLHLSPKIFAMAKQPLLAGIKHCNRLEQVMAARTAREDGYDDMLMGVEENRINCTSTANVFLLHQGKLTTPEISDAGIAGTRRALILNELAAACGFGVAESKVGMVDLQQSDGAFVTNSLLGIRFIKRIGDTELHLPRALLRLQQHYFQALRTACSL